MTNASSTPESYEFSNGSTLYSVGWSFRNDRGMRLATGTFVEQYNNLVHVVRVTDDGKSMQQYASFEHPYPTTKVGWIPDVNGSHPDLIGTTGDFLRLWRVRDDDAALTTDMTNISHHGYSTTTRKSSPSTSSSAATNNNTTTVPSSTTTTANTNITNKNNNNNHYHHHHHHHHVELNCTFNNEFVQNHCCAPLTAFDWNQKDPTLIGTSSIDTTCTIWDIQTQQRRTQLIAHDKQVYDFAFAAGSVDVFASVGADGSVRLFDLRSLDHSTIIFESRNMTPLLRLRWNTIDPNLLATVAMDDPVVELLDIRQPGHPFADLDHRSDMSTNCVNAVSWAPHNQNTIATGSDRCLALTWNIEDTLSSRSRIEPAASYAAETAIANMQWGPTNPDWIALVLDDKLRVVRV